jgi:hypothetical protein
MAAPKYTDRLKAQKLRSLAIEEMIAVFQGDDKEFKKQLLLRMATTVLPRLNEHTGENGEAIIINVSKEGAEKYGINSASSAISNTIGHA